MYVDTHCHLTFQNYDEDRAMVIGNAKKAGVKQFIVPSVDALSSQLALRLASENPGIIFAAVGAHPYEAQKMRTLSDIEPLVLTGAIAIGECGLDYHIYKGEQAQGKKDIQKRFFAEHIRLALKNDLPLIMHCRDAFDDFFDVLDSMPTLPHGVIHCFSGGLQDIRAAQTRGLYVGIDGNVTYSSHLQHIVPHIPLTMLLLETDSPYLTPIPYRGTRNEPKYIPHIAQEIATLKRITKEDVASQTTKNATSLFALA